MFFKYVRDQFGDYDEDKIKQLDTQIKELQEKLKTLQETYKANESGNKKIKTSYDCNNKFRGEWELRW